MYMVQDSMSRILYKLGPTYNIELIGQIHKKELSNSIEKNYKNQTMTLSPPKRLNPNVVRI